MVSGRFIYWNRCLLFIDRICYRKPTHWMCKSDSNLATNSHKRVIGYIFPLSHLFILVQMGTRPTSLMIFSSWCEAISKLIVVGTLQRGTVSKLSLPMFENQNYWWSWIRDVNISTTPPTLRSSSPFLPAATSYWNLYQQRFLRLRALVETSSSMSSRNWSARSKTSLSYDRFWDVILPSFLFDVPSPWKFRVQFNSQIFRVFAQRQPLSIKVGSITRSLRLRVSWWTGSVIFYQDSVHFSLARLGHHHNSTSV